MEKKEIKIFRAGRESLEEACSTGTEYGRKDERKKLVCGRKPGRI